MAVALGGLDVDSDGQHVVFHSDANPGDPSLRQTHYGIITIDGVNVSI